MTHEFVDKDGGTWSVGPTAIVNRERSGALRQYRIALIEKVEVYSRGFFNRKKTDVCIVCRAVGDVHYAKFETEDDARRFMQAIRAAILG